MIDYFKNELLFIKSFSRFESKFIKAKASWKRSDKFNFLIESTNFCEITGENETEDQEIKIEEEDDDEQESKGEEEKPELEPIKESKQESSDNESENEFPDTSLAMNFSSSRGLEFKAVEASNFPSQVDSVASSLANIVGFEKEPSAASAASESHRPTLASKASSATRTKAEAEEACPSQPNSKSKKTQKPTTSSKAAGKKGQPGIKGTNLILYLLKLKLVGYFGKVLVFSLIFTWNFTKISWLNEEIEFIALFSIGL